MALRADRLGGWPADGVSAMDDMAYPGIDSELAGSRLYALLLRGPTRGNRPAGLDELRQLVLTEGIPSDPDGTVCASKTKSSF